MCGPPCARVHHAPPPKSAPNTVAGEGTVARGRRARPRKKAISQLARKNDPAGFSRRARPGPSFARATKYARRPPSLRLLAPPDPDPFVPILPVPRVLPLVCDGERDAHSRRYARVQPTGRRRKPLSSSCRFRASAAASLIVFSVRPTPASSPPPFPPQFNDPSALKTRYRGRGRTRLAEPS